jgi:hypothetical protein
MPAQSLDDLIALGAFIYRRTVGDREVVWGVQCRNLPLTDQDIGCLRDYSELRAVGLSGTKITNASLPMLIALPHLESLDLGDTAIDDEGVQPLKQATQVEFMHLEGTRVSANGASGLQAALPRCEVCT